MEKQQNVNDAALAYMEQKYGEKFEYVGSWGVSYANRGMQQHLVKSEVFPDDILVDSIKSENGYAFKDNYLAVKYKQQMTETIKSSADDAFDDTKVFYRVPTHTLSLPTDTSFEQYSTDDDTAVSVAIAVPFSRFDKPLLGNFIKIFCEKDIGITISFVALEEDVYYSLSDTQIDDVIGQGMFRYFSVIQIYDRIVEIESEEVKQA